MNELLTLVIQFQEKVYWQIPFREWAEMRKYRQEAAYWRESDFANKESNARQLDETAEGCRKRAIETGAGRLIALENGLRQHAPELLPLVPIVDFMGEVPSDYTPWQRAMKEIEGKLRTKAASPPVAGDKPKRRNIDWWLEKLEQYESEMLDNPALTEAAFARSIGELPDTCRDGLERARAAKNERTAKLKKIRDKE